jgi:hypothetical protein
LVGGGMAEAGKRLFVFRALFAKSFSTVSKIKIPRNSEQVLHTRYSRAAS